VNKDGMKKKKNTQVTAFHSSIVSAFDMEGQPNWFDFLFFFGGMFCWVFW